jgi:hypothetical protein
MARYSPGGLKSFISDSAMYLSVDSRKVISSRVQYGERRYEVRGVERSGLKAGWCPPHTPPLALLAEGKVRTAARVEKPS